MTRPENPPSGAKKRRLPVLSSGGGEDEKAEPRPPWHWVGFGAVLLFAVWLPLAALLQKISPLWLSSLISGAATEDEVIARVRDLRGSALAQYYALTVLPQAAALAVAALASGWVVGRYGKPEAGAREAALGGAAAGLIACGLALPSTGISWAFAVVIALAAGFAGLGGRLGRR